MELQTSPYLATDKPQKNDLLKLIAMVSMVIDHIGLLFFPDILMYRTIGRIAFPIFAYLLSKGYQYTHNKLAYLKRLFIFACISQVPYMFLNTELTIELYHLNVLFLFCYSLVILSLVDYSKKQKLFLKTQFALSQFFIALCTYLFTLFMICLPFFLEIMFEPFRFSYSSYGLIMVLLFYYYDHTATKLLLGFILLNLVNIYTLGAMYFVGGLENPLTRLLSYFHSLWNKTDPIIYNTTTWKNGLFQLDGYFFQSRSILSLFLIHGLKNFKFNFQMHQYIAYSFYPIHMIILLLLRTCL